jgi:hypothetical protein
MCFFILVLLSAALVKSENAKLTTTPPLSNNTTAYDTVTWELQQFLNDNGMNYVSIVENSTAVSNLQQKLARAIAMSGVAYSKTSKMVDYLQKYVYRYLDVQIFIIDIKQDNISQFLHALTGAPVKTAILFCKTNCLALEETTIRDHLQIFGRDSMFYLFVPSASGISWYQVITLRSGYSMKELSFMPDSYQYAEDYDLNGLTIYSISDSWAPFLTLGDCNENGTMCNSYGYLKDYTDMISKQMNFTYESHRQMDGDWGVLPKSGPFNISGEWGGIMGKVIKREYDVCLSSWGWRLDRYDLLSFAIILSDKSVLIWTPKNPETDFGLFYRPFTNDSWAAVGLVTLIMVICIFFTYYVVPHTEDSNGHQLMVTVLWYFFLLLNAYYGGALTMFFTSEITIPFNSIFDVMKAYPDWKLMFLDGNEAIFAVTAENDPDYEKYWARVQESPNENKFKSLKEGLDIISKTQTVMYIDNAMLRGYFKANPFHLQRLDVFATVIRSASTLIFPHNSPLKPIFAKAAMGVQEIGLQGKELANIVVSSIMFLAPAVYGFQFFSFFSFSFSGPFICHTQYIHATNSANLPLHLGITIQLLFLF